VRVAFIQTSPSFGKVEDNVEGAVQKIRSADAELIVLPELFNTGYQFKSKKEVSILAEDAEKGWTKERLAETAKKRNLFIVAGVAEKCRGRFYNSSILIGPKGIVDIYRKAHLFWNEKRLFSPGNTPFEVYNIGHARIGMMICFDWIFPEAARTLALKGADIICHPSNLVLPHCPKAMVTRCLENRVFAITANRIGTEERIKGKKLKFIGQSGIIAPDGVILRCASDSKEETGIADIDPKKARDKNITPLNDIFKDRRKELYRQLV
jgi:predicted amidohydrolase